MGEFTKKYRNCYEKPQKKQTRKTYIISKSDQDMIDELDYEYKREYKPYDKWERHWDEA